MEKLGEDLMITDSNSLKNTLQKTVAFQEGAKKMKKLADEFIDREGIGKVELHSSSRRTVKQNSLSPIPAKKLTRALNLPFSVFRRTEDR